MRPLIIALLLVVPYFGTASTSLSANISDSVTTHFGLSTQIGLPKSGVLHRFFAKTLEKKLHKLDQANKNAPKKSGLWQALAGLAGWPAAAFSLGLVTSIGTAAVVLSLLLSIAGLILGIIGLKKAKAKENGKNGVKVIAKIAIIMNTLFLAAFIGIAIAALALKAN